MIIAPERVGEIKKIVIGPPLEETAKEIFDILKNQINPNRLIIFATHNRFFANKADCLLEMVNGNIKTINARV